MPGNFELTVKKINFPILYYPTLQEKALRAYFFIKTYVI
jgi:hypothetical protein